MSLQASREFNNFSRQAETTKMNILDFELNNKSDLSSTIDSTDSHVTTYGLHYDVLTAPVMTETSLTVEDLIEASQNIMCYGRVVAIDGYHYFVPHPAAYQTEGPLPAQELAVSEINDATLLADAATADLCGTAVSCILHVADVSMIQVKDCETTDLPFVQLYRFARSTTRYLLQPMMYQLTYLTCQNQIPTMLYCQSKLHQLSHRACLTQKSTTLHLTYLAWPSPISTTLNCQPRGRFVWLPDHFMEPGHFMVSVKV
jgi:hypothetical protein